MDEPTPEMTVLDLISSFREAEHTIRSFDEQAGECICCNSLFDSLVDVARKYDLDLHELMQKIREDIGLKGYSQSPR